MTSLFSSLRSQSLFDHSFDTLRSSKEMGCSIGEKETTFRLFAPRADKVILVIFDNYNDENGNEIPMMKDNEGVWEFTSQQSLLGKFYGYKIQGPQGKGELFNPALVIADPYSKAVATKNNWHHPAKTLIMDTRFDWQEDTFVIPADHSRLVIYESHVRDLTLHESSGILSKGTYLGLTEEGVTGGLSYLKDLGVNAIELLPCQKFGVMELPFKDTSVIPYGYPVNTWNPYARNHWGYMTSFFFAPETYYGTDGTVEPEKYNGTDGRAVNEMKTMVKALHQNGIAVIMDVVYNHVSQYDFNPLKYIDKFYYFNCDSNGNFIGTSGCGNDFNTKMPMARKLIVESVKYWMMEYHIDGFRFDLAAMIDWETCKEITREAKKINPNVILIAEPWGGGKYDLAGFSNIGWAAWNDLIRNGVKGQNPKDGLGFIFGKFQGGNSKKSFMSYLTGSLREDGGPFLTQEHSINYLESHDDNTMGDFIRLALGDAKENQKVADINTNAKLTDVQLKLNKLAALFLFSSQGPIMLHEGQEYARSKVIAPTSIIDPETGFIDHNSYNKDNETNYLNYDFARLNRNLVDYYSGLIKLRKKYPLLGSATKNAIEFQPSDDSFQITFLINPKKIKETIKSPKIKKDKPQLIALNGNPMKPSTVELPKGSWNVLVNGEKIFLDGKDESVSGKITIPPTSGMILIKE